MSFSKKRKRGSPHLAFDLKNAKTLVELYGDRKLVYAQLKRKKEDGGITTDGDQVKGGFGAWLVVSTVDHSLDRDWRYTVRKVAKLNPEFGSALAEHSNMDIGSRKGRIAKPYMDIEEPAFYLK